MKKVLLVLLCFSMISVAVSCDKSYDTSLATSDNEDSNDGIADNLQSVHDTSINNITLEENSCLTGESEESIQTKQFQYFYMSNLLEVKYYCPLKVLVYEENEYGDIDESDSYELDGRFADSYEYEIRERLSEYCDDLDMAEYFNADHKNIHKLKEVKWDVESVDGTLYGCITATLTDYFTDEEEETFKDWVYTQRYIRTICL